MGRDCRKTASASRPLITSGDKSDDEAMCSLSRSPPAQGRPLAYDTPERCTTVNVVINASAESEVLIAL